MAGEDEEVMIDQPLLKVGLEDSNGAQGDNGAVAENAAPSSLKKRTRTGSPDVEISESSVKRQKGVAPIKAELAASRLIRYMGNC